MKPATTRMRIALTIATLVVATGPGVAQTGSIGANFQTIDNSTTGSISGFTVQPPDTTGAVGLNHFIAFNNGSFSIFNKSGGLVSRVNDGVFWNNAGIAGVSTAVLTDPRILYDPTSRRWFAVEITTSETTNNRILIARSNTSDPTAGFSAVTLTTSNGTFADFPTLGIDTNGVVIGTNNFNGAGTMNLSTSIYSMPKADIVSNSPPSLTNLAQATIAIGTNGSVPNPATNFGPKLTTESTPIIWGFNSTNRAIAKITGTSAAGATLAARNLVVVNANTQPNNAGQGAGTITNGDTRHGTHSVQVGNFMYTATATNDSGVGGRTSARWTIYNVANSPPTLVSQGNYTDPTLSVFYPSISVNTAGDVVMGFSGSTAGQFIGTYAVVGTSSGPGGAITFGTAFQTRAGVGQTTNVRWGDYSTTNNDPTDPGIFWTHQEFSANAGSNWATQATEIIPTKAGERRWSNSSGGAFNTSTNYFTNTAPVATDNMFFSRPATYSISFSGPTTSNRAFVRQGNVTWDMAGNSYTLSQTGATTPSLAVSDFQGTSNLTLSNGTLTTANATIGAGFGGNGTVNVGGASAASWNNSGTIYVGGNSTGPQGGTGRLTVNTGSQLNNALGTVQVHPGGTVGGNGTILGAVTVTGGSTTVYSDGSTSGTNRVSVNSITVPAATIAPGTSVGTIATGPLTINNGGSYAWEVSAAGTGNVGPNTGLSDAGATKDLINTVGFLSLTNPQIEVIGLGATGFNNTLNYSWTIANFTGAGTLNGTPTFVLTNISVLAGSEFSLGFGSGQLYLNYSPVPEPAFILALGAAAGIGGTWWRKRRYLPDHSVTA